MDKVLKNYEGLIDSEGTYTFKDGRFVMDGRVTAPHFSIMEDFLKKRLSPTHNECHIRIDRKNDLCDVTLTELAFKGTPIFHALYRRFEENVQPRSADGLHVDKGRDGIHKP